MNLIQIDLFDNPLINLFIILEYLTHFKFLNKYDN